MSSDSSSVIKRTVRRTIVGDGGAHDLGDVNIHRTYEVYRGMSPVTSNRLEQRIKELEDALDFERQARSRSEQELSEISYEFDSMTERIEEYESASVASAEASRRREAELAKLRKDYELLVVQHESSETSLRKRHQEAINELSAQIDQLNKHKSKFDKDKQHFIIEIETLSSAYEESNKAKAYAESKLEALEDQLRRAKLQIDELSRQNAELNSWKTRVSQEYLELQRTVTQFESSSGGWERSRATLVAQLEDYKSKLDDESRERNQLTIVLTNLQVDYDNVSGRLDEEAETSASLRGQLQRALTDYAALKSKYDQDITSRIEEFEDSRRKLVARIAELESENDQLRNRASKFEKDKLKLQIDIRDITSELEESNANVADLSKRLKHSEGLNVDLQRRTDELSSTLQNSSGDNQRLQAELVRFKAALGDLEAKYEALLRENKQLSDALAEAKDQIKRLSREVTDFNTMRLQIEANRDQLAIELRDTQDALRDAQGRLESGNNSLLQFKSDFELRLRGKDEELENIRKQGQRTISELTQTIIETETKYKAELSRYKKKYETELHELEIQVDSLSRSNGELAKANKSLASRVKELEIALEEERRGADDAKNHLTLVERKNIALQTALEDLRALLDAAERARKNAENALGEASSRINELTITITSVSNERRRYESELAAIHNDAAEAHRGRASEQERADRLQLEVNRLLEELRREQENYKNAESVRKSLEIEIREITVRLEESENIAQREGKRLVAKLQARLHDVEAELDAEQRRGRDYVAENKKLVRLLLELRVQADEDHRLVIELTEQINSFSMKIAILKRQLIEAHDVVTITMNKYRKAQQQCEDAERRADTAERNITVHVSRHHGSQSSGGSRARSMSITRETRVIRS